MRDFKLNENGDVDISGNQIQLIHDGDEVAQRVVTTLRTRLLEFEPATTLGLAQDNLFGKYSNLDFAKQDIEDAITEQVADVVSVDKVDMTIDNATREMRVEIKFSTSSGSTQNIQTSVGGD